MSDAKLSPAPRPTARKATVRGPAQKPRQRFELALKASYRRIGVELKVRF